MCQARSKAPSPPSSGHIPFFILASSSASSGLSVFSAGSWALLYTCGWGRVWIQRDWEGDGSLLGENFVNKVGFSVFQPAASFFRARCSHGKGVWGSTGRREGVSGWFFSSQTVLCQTEGKLHTGTSKGVEKSSLEEPDLRLSLPEKEGEKGKIQSSGTRGSFGICTGRTGGFQGAKEKESELSIEADGRLGVTILCCKDAPCGDCALVSPEVAVSTQPLPASCHPGFTCQRGHKFLWEPKQNQKQIFIFKAPLIHFLVRRGDKPFTERYKMALFALQVTCSHCGSHKAEQASLGALKKNQICSFFGYCCYLSLPLLP